MTPIHFSAGEPAMTPERRHRRPVPFNEPYGFPADMKVCRAPQYVITPDGLIPLAGPYCGDWNESVTGPIPYWLALPGVL